jgi:hypothetical protein
MNLTDRKEIRKIYSAHWKAWFAANKHRFPEWHPPKEEENPEQQPPPPSPNN